MKSECERAAFDLCDAPSGPSAGLGRTDAVSGGLLGRIVWSGVPGLVVGAIFWHLVGSSLLESQPLISGAGVSEHAIWKVERNLAGSEARLNARCTDLTLDRATGLIIQATCAAPDAEVARNSKSQKADFSNAPLDAGEPVSN